MLGVIPKKISNRIFLFVAAVILTGGFFAVSYVFAIGGGVSITPASGGENISIDTTSASGTPAWKSLSGPTINETAPGSIHTGTHTFNLPAGWEFKTDSTVTVVRTVGDIEPESQVITPGTNSFTFTITNVSTANSGLAFIMSSLKVRPTGTTPSTGDITHSSIDGATIVGVDDGTTSFGTLSTVPGTVVKLAFTTEPGGAVYGSLLGPQPVVRTQDQFGNNSTSGLIATEMVSLSLTGTGVLQGTTSLNIGTGGSTPGTVTFTDLKVGDVGAIGTKGLTASAGTLTNAVSNNFEITQKPLTATVTVNNKTYDGNNSAVITGVTLNGVEAGDDVTVSNNGTATFASPNAATGIVVTSNGVTITGAHTGNYLFGGTATGSANITPLEITVTPTAGQNKIYGQTDPVFTYTNTPALIVPNVFSGSLSRIAGEDVNIYTYTLGTLENGLDNYTLTLAPETFEITQKPLTVAAIGVDKEYDQTTNATVTLSSADEESGDNLVYAYTSASFLTKTAENGKTVNVSGIGISGAKAGNYELQNTEAITTANITKKSITATLNLNNKTYDGDTSAAFSPGIHIVLNDLVSGDDVIVTNEGSKSFTNKHVGTGKTVNATGIILGGIDAGNYDFNGAGTGMANITQRSIIITAVTDTKTYNGTTNSAGTPTTGALQGTDTANFTQTYDNKNVGTVKTLTPSGVVNDGNGGANYSYTFVNDTTGVITKKSINVTAQPDTKIYDGTTNSSVAPVVGALEVGDTTTTAPTQSYDTKDVWINKVLTASGLVINDDNGGANYNIIYVNNGTGIINAKGLTVSGAITNSKTYDGNVVATVNFASAELVGIVLGEEALVSLDSTGYSAIFDNKNVATGKTVTVLGLDLTGVGASNYSLTQPILNDGAITQKTLTVTATGVNKIYDANTTATVTLGDNRVGGDVLTLGYTANFSDKNVANSKAVSVTGISITGGVDAGNYTLGNTTAGATADITQASLTATVTVANKVIDGNNSATITGRALIGVLGTDAVTPNADGVATFAEATVGAHAVSATGITITGADAGNYSYNGAATGIGNILPIPTTVYVDDDFSEGSDGEYTFGYDAFATIQEGVDAVASNGTVNVAIGTYDEQLQINKDITISGAAGATIQPTGDDNAWDIQFVAGGSGATFEGFTLDFNGTADNRAGRGIAVSDLNGPAVTNVTIQNNDIMMGVGIGAATVGLEGVGVQTGKNANVGGLQILNNDFHAGSAPITDGATQGEEGIYINPNAGAGTITISGNNFDGELFTGISVEADNVNVNNNTIIRPSIIQNTNGIRVNDFVGSANYSVIISGNTVSNMANGIRLGSGSEGGSTLTVSLTDNAISNNTRGIWARYDAVVTADDNEISGNALFGADILSGSDGALNAAENWWGSNTGPTHSANTGGIGDAVSDNVLFTPWCLTDDCSPIDSTAPVAVLSGTPANPTNQTSADITVSGDAQVVYYKSKLDGGAYGAVTPVATHIALSSLSDGSHTLLVVGRDQSGNWQTEGSATTYTWTIDTGVPSAPVITNIAGDNFINDSEKAAVHVIGTAEAGATVSVTLTGGITVGPVTGTANGVGAFDITLDATTLTDGTITPSVTATDAAGNTSAADTAPTALKDTSAPVISINDGASASWTQTDTINLTVTETNPSTSKYGFSVNSTCNALDAINTDFTSAVSFDLADDHTDYLCAKAADTAGNETYYLVGQLNTDNTNPDLTLNSMFTGQTLTGGNVYPISWTASDLHLSDTPVKLEYSVNGGTSWTTITEATANDGSENWTVPSVNTSNGLVRTTVTDLANNVSQTDSNTFSITYSIVTDSTAPVATLNSPNGGETWENNAAHLITWTATDNLTAASSLDIKLAYSTDGGTNWNTIIADTENDGAYSWTPTGLNSANVLIKVTATDAANLTGSDVSDTVLTIATPVAYPESICTGSGPYTCTIALSSGWNLISFPIIPTDTAIATVLTGVSGTGTATMVKYYDSTESDDWKSYVPGSGGDLTTMSDGKGYWVNMTNSATLTVTGTSAPTAPNPPSTYSVITGWNLIGYKSLTAYQNASSYLSTIPSGYIVFDQNNTNKTSSYLQHGQGYWLWSTGAGSFVAGD